MFMAPVMDELKSRQTFVEHAKEEVQEIDNEEKEKDVGSLTVGKVDCVE